MFDGVARRYDLTNTVLSLGQDRYWRKATRSALRAGPNDRVLDPSANAKGRSSAISHAPGEASAQKIVYDGVRQRCRSARVELPIQEMRNEYGVRQSRRDQLLEWL